jgi:O-antigen ligase
LRKLTPPFRFNLSNLTVWHSAIFATATAWLFGGNIYWARTPLACWGTLAIGLTIAGFIHRGRGEKSAIVRPLIWLAPGVTLITLIVVSAFNPSFEIRTFYETKVYHPIEPISWLPSSAIPSSSLREVWLFGGLYLTGFNLVLNVTSVRQLRGLIIALAVNATGIAIMGTVQRLLGLDLFFGLVVSPNPAFFGCFIYHNHWGAYAVLSLSLWLGASVWLAHRDGGRGITHSPAMAALLAAALIVVAVPLSTSRSSTLLIAGFMIIAAIAEGIRLTQKPHREKKSTRLLLAAMASAVLITLTATYFLAAPIIARRIATTQSQISQMQASGTIGERSILYSETWALFEKKPWTGWGFETWEMVFRRNTQLTHRGDHLPIRYQEAHSDWLQSFSEIGALGTGLLLAMALIPLWSSRRHVLAARTSLYLLGGPALIAVYAWIEFPLANPAVALTFWITFFTSIRYARIIRT